MSARGTRAAVRVSLTEASLNGWGLVSNDAIREVRTLLFDVPAGAPVVIDLGPCQRADFLLMSAVRAFACAPRITFESRYWQVALDAAHMLDELLDAPEEVAKR